MYKFIIYIDIKKTSLFLNSWWKFLSARQKWKTVRKHLQVYFINALTVCYSSIVLFCLLLSESVLLLFAPHIHHLPVLVHLHGVIHQSVHVDELDALLLSIKQHRRDDCQLSHLLLCVLMHTEAIIIKRVGQCWQEHWQHHAYTIM